MRVLCFHYNYIGIYIYRIFSEIDGSLDFNEILVSGSVVNVVSMENISFLRKSLFKKLSAFKVIYFICNTEENETFIFHIYCMLQKTFRVKKKKTDISNLIDTTFSYYASPSSGEAYRDRQLTTNFEL